MRQRGLARRRFLQGGLGLAGLGMLSGCGVLPPPAPTPPRTARIGVLTTPAIGSSPVNRALLDSLRAAGWTQGENLRIEYRFAQTPENVAVTVPELMAMQLDAIVVENNSPAKALKAATTSIPIVMALCSDPVRTGLIASLARPGGNVTGVASLSAELTEKRFDFLKQVLPLASRILCVWIPDVSVDAIDEAAIRDAGNKVGLEIRFFRIGMGGDSDVRNAFAAAANQGVHAVVMLSDSTASAGYTVWRDLVATTHLPVFSGNADLARAGTLMAYGPRHPDLFRRAGAYVDKILRGAKPADVPVEQPTEFDFVVNERVARASRLTIPDSVVKQATEIVQ